MEVRRHRIRGVALIVGMSLVATSAWLEPAGASTLITTYKGSLAPPAAGGSPGDQAGSSVAVSGDTAVVGEPFADVNGHVDAGRAEVFVRSGSTWSYQQTIYDPGGGAGDAFGSSVAIDGNTIAVGSPAHDAAAPPPCCDTSTLDAGSVVVFTRSGTTWSQQATLTAYANNYGGVDPGSRFGSSVAITGDTVVVGAPMGDGYDDALAIRRPEAGRAYVFARSGTTWSQTTELRPDVDNSIDHFGASVAISGGTILVGVPDDDTASVNGAGAVEVFFLVGGTWSRDVHMNDPRGAGPGDRFGATVALSVDTALIGAPEHDAAGGLTDAGSAVVLLHGASGWAVQSSLGPPTPRANDEFGKALALDGDTAVVRSHFSSSGTDPGAAHVFVRSGTTWGWQATLAHPTSAAASGFGDAVAINVNTVVVGAPLDDQLAGLDAGSAHPFLRTGTSWAHQGTLLAAADDQMGSAVAISGNTMVVGSPRDDTGAGGDAGSAQVYVRSGSTWSLQATLLHPAASAFDQFGYSVAISGDIIVVGAPYDDTAAGVDAGSAHVFVRVGSTWSYQQTLADNFTAGSLAGYSVAVSGTTALIGVPESDPAAGADAGAARVYLRTGSPGTWSLQQDLVHPAGAASDQFGVSVALDGDTAVVGAPYDTTPAGTFAGSAQVFFRTGTTWASQGQLTHPSGASGDNFGWSVGLSGNTAIAGSHRDDTAKGGDAGTAHVFVRSGSTWSFQQTLDDPNGAANDWFGWSVSVNGDTALVGDFLDDTAAGGNAGSAHLFRRQGTTWTHQPTLLHPQGAAGDQFGFAVAVSPDTAAVGANVDDTAMGADSGSVQVFSVLASAPPADFDGDGLTDLSVFRPSIGAWLAKDSSTGNLDQTYFAAAGDLPLPGDYDGIARAEPAVYRPSTGAWFVRNPATGIVTQTYFGNASDDVPVPADYDGDGKLDLAVYRPSAGLWLVRNSSDGSTSSRYWGAPGNGDTPVPADYDGDGKADFAVYRLAAGQWFVVNSSNGSTSQTRWGNTTDDVPVPGVYDTDAKADIAVYRPSTGAWFVINSSGGTNQTYWGSSGDAPMPGDYDGDGRTDLAVFRRSIGAWFLLRSTAGPTQVYWGNTSNDIPLPLPYAVRHRFFPTL